MAVINTLFTIIFAVELLALPANMVKLLDLRYACAAVFGSVAVAHWRNNTLDSFLADHKSMPSTEPRARMLTGAAAVKIKMASYW